jgi:hypothetical protein
MNPLYKNLSAFSDLLVEIYQDGGEKKPSLSVKSHKLVLVSHSGYILKMLTGRESDSKIKLTTAYPKSLEKMLLSFYDHVLKIESAEELIEMLYLADEYDIAEVRKSLKNDLFRAKNSPSFEITTTNAKLLLDCSQKLDLKLEKIIFNGLVEQWDEFGPLGEYDTDYEGHQSICRVLLQSLKFKE